MQRRAVVLEADEKKVYTLIQSINTLRKEKEAKRKAKVDASRAAYQAKKQKTEEMDVKMSKERKKEFFKELGQKRRREEAANDRSAGKRSKRD